MTGRSFILVIRQRNLFECKNNYCSQLRRTNLRVTCTVKMSNYSNPERRIVLLFCDHFLLDGKIYSLGEVGTDNSEDDNELRVKRIEASLRPSPATRDVWNGWAASATEGSRNIGNVIASVLEDASSAERGSADGNCHARLDFLQSRLSSAAALLQMVQLCGDGCNIAGATKPADPNATGRSLQEALRRLSPEMTHGNESTGASDIDLIREESFKDLTKAVAMLQAEVAAQKNIVT